MALHRDTVTIYPRASTLDSDENGTPQYDQGTPIVLVRAQVSPLQIRTAVTNAGEVVAVTGRWRVSTARGDLHPEIEENVRVDWRGQSYKVQGMPETFYAVTPHTEFIIIRSEG